MVPSTGQSKNLSTALAGTFHCKKIPLAENMFFQADKGAENTKEKIQAVLYAVYEDQWV